MRLVVFIRAHAVGGVHIVQVRASRRAPWISCTRETVAGSALRFYANRENALAFISSREQFATRGREVVFHYVEDDGRWGCS